MMKAFRSNILKLLTPYQHLSQQFQKSLQSH